MKLLVATCIVLLSAPAAAQRATLFSDVDFSSWTTEPTLSHQTVAGARVAHPGAGGFRYRVTHTHRRDDPYIPNVGSRSSYVGPGVNAGFTDPDDQLEVSVRIEQEGFLTYALYDGWVWQPALRQAGTIYRASKIVQERGRFVGALTLAPADFIRVNGRLPDLSPAGAPIQFGFILQTVLAPAAGSEAASIEVFVDDLKVDRIRVLRGVVLNLTDHDFAWGEASDGRVPFEVTVANLGPLRADVELEIASDDTVSEKPFGISFSEGINPGWSCGGNYCRLNLGDLPAGAVRTVAFAGIIGHDARQLLAELYTEAVVRSGGVDGPRDYEITPHSAEALCLCPFFGFFCGIEPPP